MKKLNFIMVLMMVFLLISCEVPTSFKFEHHLRKAENNSENWTEEDWEMSKEKYRQLLKEYEENYDNMSPEERNKVNKAIGRYNGILMKNGIKKVDESINEFIDRLPSLFEGFMSAFEEEMEDLDDRIEKKEKKYEN